MTAIKNHWQLIFITVSVFALWNTTALVPLKILVVFFHEASHGFAAILTGGEIESLAISAQQGGVALTRGGSIFWIASAGYIGSLLIGVVLFLVARHTRFDRALMGLLGFATLALAAFYIREPFALTFSGVAGILMLSAAYFLPQTVNDLTIRVIALTSMIYVPYDIISDTILRPHLRSDAVILAENFGGNALVWGGLWLLISLGIIAANLRFGFGHTSNIAFHWMGGPRASKD